MIIKMQPFKISSKNELFSGLSFSLSDVNLDNSGLNLVPITENNDYTQNPCLSKKDILPPQNFSSTVQDKSDIVPPTGIGSLNSLQESFDSSGIHSRYVLNPEARVRNTDTQDVFNSTGKQNIIQYEPVSHHWFYQTLSGTWRAFSVIDSAKLECRYGKICVNDLADDCVAVDGGRFDVRIKERVRVAVYWSENVAAVRRVSWLYREEEGRCQVPYSEIECALLEKQYEAVVRQGLWRQWLQVVGISDIGVIESQFVFHTPHTMAEYRRYAMDETLRARVVYRGIASFSHMLERGDSDEIDHVVLVVHGIGPVCDMYGHTLVECVSAMRRTSAAMMRDHGSELDKRTVSSGHTVIPVGRVEYLPVCWHSSLHAHIDNQLSKITLSSVPKLRVFTNGTLVDVLCYSSPAFSQSILTSVATEMNRLRHLFMSRNPYYGGTFSIVGHSLGAVIALDLVSLQHPSLSLNVPLIDSTEIPLLEFELGHIFALGSPISLFLTARGISYLGEDFHFSKCKGVFNIFHPFDPVAYRLEPMICRDYPTRPLLIPHHKGRKRLHLELKDNIVKVGFDLKSKLLQTLKITWSSLQEFASAHSTSASGDFGEEEVMRAISKIDDDIGEQDEFVEVISDHELNLGMFNGGRRVDYVLQETPLESFNDYLFALGSHACYWESEDTVLQILKEIYVTLDIKREQHMGESDLHVPSQLNAYDSYQSNVSQSSLPMEASPVYSKMVDSRQNVLPFIHMPVPPPMPLPAYSQDKRAGPCSSILPPTLPSMQGHSFFQPADGDMEPVDDVNFGLERGPPMIVPGPLPVSVIDAPPPMAHVYVSDTATPSDSTSTYLPGLSSIYYQSQKPMCPSLSEAGTHFFQPPCGLWDGVVEVNTFFSEAPSNGRDDAGLNGDPASSQSTFYHNLDSVQRGSGQCAVDYLAPVDAGYVACFDDARCDQWETPASAADTHDWPGQRYDAAYTVSPHDPPCADFLDRPGHSVVSTYFSPSLPSSVSDYFGPRAVIDGPPSASSSGSQAVIDRPSKSSPKDFLVEDARRSPSPIVFSSNPRNTPRGTAVAPTVFNSRPLIPQSGRLFNKKKM